MSNKKLYSGKSEGLSNITDGYVEYAHEVIVNRAIPDLRDGLKPVQRRLLHIANHVNPQLKKGQKSGSLALVGDTSKIHPHDGESVYGALVRLVDSAEYINVPLFKGGGGFSKAYMAEGPAASRYTSVTPSPNIKDFFTAPDGMEWKESEVGGVEPAVLPVSYPYVLTMGGTGVAVSVATNIPSFNFWDVLDITEKFVKTGSLGIDDMIAPDYASGGHYIMDREELAKVMLSGKGRIKVRASVEIRGREIIVTELPVDTTIDNIKRKINAKIVNKEYPGIVSVDSAVGFGTDDKVVILCRSAAATEEVLLRLYRDNILQSRGRSSILTVKDGKPVFGGVFKIVEEWIEWRKEVLERQFKHDLDAIAREQKLLSYFVRLIGNPEWKKEYIRLITEVAKSDADRYLRSLFDDIDGDSVDWIGARRASAFLTGDKYAARYKALGKEEEHFKGLLSDLDAVILDDIAKLRVSHKGQHARKTEVTLQDYIFSSRVAETAEDKKVRVEQAAVPVWFTINKEGFLRVTPNKLLDASDDGILASFQGMSTDVLIGFDNLGRVLRYYAAHEPTHTSGTGVYLPRYFDVPDELQSESDFQYKILYMTKLEGQELMLLFTDGYASFVDTSKWVDAKANYRVVTSGVNKAVEDKLLDVIEGDNIPDTIIVADNNRSPVYRFGKIDLTKVEKTKVTTGRRKVAGGGDVSIEYWTPVGEELAADWINVEDASPWEGRVKALPRNNMRLLSSELAFEDPVYTS